MSTFLTYNPSKAGIQQAVNGMQQVRNGRELLRIAIADLQTMIDNDGAQTSDYATMATLCGFPDAATAKASWDEINSLFGKISTDSSVSSVYAAVNQCCAKHGV